LQCATDPVVSGFKPFGFGGVMQSNIARSPQFSPALKADLQNAGVRSRRRFYSDHPVRESAAAPILPRTVKIASRVTGRPDTLRAMLAPGQNRSRPYASSEMREGTPHLVRDLIRTLDTLIGFCFVHGWIGVGYRCDGAINLPYAAFPLCSVAAGLKALELRRAHPLQAGQASLEPGSGVRPLRRRKQVDEGGAQQSNTMMQSERSQKA
jgi:hypothetical protein